MTNPYQPPESHIPENFGINTKNGTLLDGINGNYDFSIMAVLKEAWEKTNGMKAPVLGASLVLFIIIIVLGMGIIMFTQSLGYEEDSDITSLLSQLAFLIIYPFLAGIMMLGVRHSVNLPVSFSIAFSYFGYTRSILFVAILITMFTMIGYTLLIIPGVYLSIAYLLAIPLLIEKNLSPWQAMEASRKAITHHWFKVFLTYVIMLSIYILSIIPFCIGLIWSLPMMANVTGILFRIMFGVEESQEKSSLASIQA